MQLPFFFFCSISTLLAFSSETGEAELRLDVPDSITTWVAEAVGLSEEKGLGLAKRAELRTFKPFFVDFTLPYSLIRGEQTKVPLTVYNYLPTCAEVRRRMEEVSPSISHCEALYKDTHYII